MSDELKPVYALDFPASLGNPWVDAVCEYLVACLSAILLNDWNELVEKYAAMITEQNRYFGAYVASSSGAATELDYYGGES